MTVAVSMECPVCAGTVDINGDILLGELIDCAECGSELEVTSLEPNVELQEAPMAAEDWGQ